MDMKAIDSLLSQLHAAAAAASGKGAAPSATSVQAGAFSDLLKNSLDQVNTTQKQAETLARDFQMGNSEVSLHDVMLASSKANIAFQATVQVRNRLVSAYHDIMSMPL